MVRFLFLAFFLLNSPCLLAQKFEINLAKKKMTQPLQNFAVSEIIDLRYDKSNIGWVQKGLSSEKVQANFKTNIDQELKAFIQNNISGFATSRPFIIKINKLEITESWNGIFQYASAEVALEFLIRKADGSGYCPILNTGSFREPYLTSDVSKLHDDNLTVVLEDCFTQISKLNVTEICSKTPAVSEAYLQVNTYFNLDRTGIPMLQASVPIKGVYLNFHEFKNNAPGLDQEVALDKNGKFIYIATKKKVEKVWGFSDGKNAFILHADDKNYYPLIKLGDQFVYNGSTTIYNDDAISAGKVLGVVAGGTMGGGGLLASELTKKKSTAQFTLNMITGKLTQVQKSNRLAIPNQKGKIVMFRNFKNEAAVPISIYQNDSLIAVFPPNSISDFEFEVSEKSMNLCLMASNQNCQQISPNPNQTIYFECSLPDKQNAQPILKAATQKEADYYLKIIKHNQDKSKK